MPSPPLCPDDGPIDFAHLSRMTLGDAGLEHQVLAMFSAQSGHLIDAIANAGRRTCIGAYAEGSARAIPAPFAVADAAAGWNGVSQAPSIRSERLAALGEAVSLATEGYRGGAPAPS